MIHLAADQMKKTGAKIVEGENLDVTIGSIPLKEAAEDEKEREAVKANILRILKKTTALRKRTSSARKSKWFPAAKRGITDWIAA